MIALVQRSAEGEQGLGFMALRRIRGGALVPITGDIERTADRAARVCQEDLRQRLTEVRENVGRELGFIEADLDHLTDQPGPDDRVRIAGVEVSHPRDGLVLPPPDEIARFPRRVDVVPIDISSSLFTALETAMRLESGNDDSAALMIDCALDQPVELLMAVARSSPEHLCDAAAFVVQVHRSLHSDRASGDERASDGVVRRAIDDEDPGDSGHDG